jgi:hypothetical protein
MKKVITVIVSFLILTSCTKALEVNGSKEEVGDKTIIRLWGSHEERGFAYGYLLADEIYDVYVDYFVKTVFGGDINELNQAEAIMFELFNIDEEYENEAKAIINGIEAADKGDDFEAVLGRKFTYKDLLLANGIVELYTLSGCSSLSSWGAATEDDPELQGELVITRQLDWDAHPALIRNQLLTVHLPASKGEQAWLSFGFPGLIGALSTINQSGIAAFHHVGNIEKPPFDKKYDFIFFSIRNGIEKYDLNGDAKNSIDDVIFGIERDNQYGGWIVDVANSIAAGDSAVVIETNNAVGTIVRSTKDNVDIKGTNLVATNHFCSMYEPESCTRYAKLVDSIDANQKFDALRQWNVLGGAAGISGNLYTVQYIPFSGEVKWATTTFTKKAYESEPYVFYLQDMLKPTDVEDIAIEESIAIYPNPAKDMVNFKTEMQGRIEIEIIDQMGRRVEKFASNQKIIQYNCSQLTSGKYLVKIIDGSRIRVGMMTIIK